MSRPNPEWWDPTANDAIANIDRSKKRHRPRGRGGKDRKKLVDITERRVIPPLSKFDDPTTARGRSRLLADLNHRYNETPKSDAETRATLFKDIRQLEQQQYRSRTSPISKF